MVDAVHFYYPKKHQLTKFPFQFHFKCNQKKLGIAFAPENKKLSENVDILWAFWRFYGIKSIKFIWNKTAALIYSPIQIISRSKSPNENKISETFFIIRRWI